MNKTTAARIVQIYIILVVLYALYGVYSYTGIYKWLAEWQLAQFKSYNTRLTLAGAIFLPALPAWLIATIFRIPYRTGWIGGKSGDKSSGSPSHLTWMAVFGLIAIAVASGSALLGYYKSQHVSATENLDLSLQNTAQSDHVRLTGIAHTDMVLELKSSAGPLKTYVPLTPPNWRRTDPLVYFLLTNVDAYIGPDGKVTLLDPKTPPFRMTQTGVLVPDDLPGPIAEAYRKNGLILASPPLVLELETGADLARYWVVAGVGGFFGVILLFVSLLGRLGQRTKAAA
jgi:hypothetical protein